MNFVSHWCCFGILTAFAKPVPVFIFENVLFRAATCRLCFSFSRMADDGFSFYSMAFKSCKEYNFR